MNEAKTRYPLILVHGMYGWGDAEGINKKAPYWGGTTGSIVEYLKGKGIECYATSEGPISSAWDQACELYAQLKETRVDYGEHHSRVYGHKHFGRTYKKPLFENWSAEKKVHLIGHSFGGHVIRLLTYLLENGAPDEIALNREDTSPLFLGGQKDLVCSVSAICSPLNGTDAYQSVKRYHLLPVLKLVTLNSAVLLARTKLQGGMIDVHLEQMGVNKTEEIKDTKKFIPVMKDLFICKESIDFDMTDKGTEQLNGFVKNVSSVYYFSYPYNLLEKNEKGKLVPQNTKNPLMKLTANLMLRTDKALNKTTVGTDGLIDVASAMHPANEPYKPYAPNVPLDSGIWNVMPTGKGDHGTPIGLFADKEETHKFYDDMVDILSRVESNA